MSIPVRLIQVYAVPYAYAPNGEPLYVEYSSLSLSSTRKRRAPEPSTINNNNNLNIHNTNPKRKSRLVWTHSLHQSFLNAVQTLGVDIAVPKQIMKIMNVHSLTRENVASHLQKYRAALKRDQQRNNNNNNNNNNRNNQQPQQIANTEKVAKVNSAQNGNAKVQIHPPPLRISKFPLELVLNSNNSNGSDPHNRRGNIHHHHAIPKTVPTSNSISHVLVQPPPASTMKTGSPAITSPLSTSASSLPQTPPPPPSISLSTNVPPSIRRPCSLPIPPPAISISTNLSPVRARTRAIGRNSTVPAPSIRTLPIPPPPISLHTPRTMAASLPPIRTLSFRSPV